jgi:hypothetical protein
MSKYKFVKLFNGVNCPEHRGAPHLVFDKFAINEFMFADKLRFKWWDINFNQNQINLKWVTQGCFENEDEDIYPFLTEVQRCIQKTIGFTGNIIVELVSRNGEEYGFYKTTIVP